MLSGWGQTRDQDKGGVAESEASQVTVQDSGTPM